MIKFDYVNHEQIIELFAFLKHQEIEFILLRNINDELPYKLQKTKDIDILVNPIHKSKLKKVLNLDGWLNIWHPWDFGNNFKFLYSMDKFLMFKKGDIHLDICFQISCRSFNDREWFPLDESIQISSFKNKRHVNSIWSYELSFEDELIHLITRCIFDKICFNDGYINKIEILLKKIDLELFKIKCNKVFFKFSTVLVKLIIDKKYDDIRSKYLTFKDY
tara:strand:+ start:1026 stop:1682 length:657 start_codon:yes stop_codon:yes gene_type:complete